MRVLNPLGQVKANGAVGVGRMEERIDFSRAGVSAEIVRAAERVGVSTVPC